jgi:hypothetical protein
MENLPILLITLGIWGILSLIICIPICSYIINKTDREELAYFIFPSWLFLSAIILELYMH